MKKALIGIIATALATFLVVSLARTVWATEFPKTICHHTPANNVTLTFQNHQSYNGHLGQPHNNQTFDTNGPCVVPSPSPTASPTATPSATPTATPSATPQPSPTASPSATPEPRVEPSATPSATPIPQVYTPVETVSDGGPGVPHFECDAIPFVPTLTSFERLSPTSVKVKWTHTDPQNLYMVWYGLSQDKLVWNTGIVPGWEVTLNDLPANLSIWVGVQASDGHCLGGLSQIIDP